MSNFTLGKYEEDSFKDQLKFIEESAKIVLNDRIEILTSIPWDEIEKNNEDFSSINSEIDSLLEDFKKKSLNLNENLISTLKRLRSEDYSFLTESDYYKQHKDILDDIMAIKMPLIFDFIAWRSQLVAEVWGNTGFSVKDYKVIEGLIINFLDDINIEEIDPKDFKIKSKEFEHYYKSYKIALDALIKINESLINETSPEDKFLKTEQRKIERKITNIAKRCIDSNRSDLDNEVVQFWTEKGGVKKRKKERRFPERLSYYAGLPMKDAINKALLKHHELSPKEISEKIFTKEAIVQEGNKINKNIAAVLSREKNKNFKSLGNGKWKNS